MFHVFLPMAVLTKNLEYRISLTVNLSFQRNHTYAWHQVHLHLLESLIWFTRAKRKLYACVLVRVQFGWSSLPMFSIYVPEIHRFTAPLSLWEWYKVASLLCDPCTGHAGHISYIRRQENGQKQTNKWHHLVFATLSYLQQLSLQQWLGVARQ